MVRVNFDVSDWLINQIDEVRDQWGFKTRAEFFRHLAIEFVEKRGQIGVIDPPEPKTKLQEIMDKHIGFGIPQEAIAELERLAAQRKAEDF